jgi:acyl-CoA thioesterase FadM
VTDDAGAAGRRSLTVPYRIRFDEAGPDGLARGSALLRIVQDAAWRHSEALGYTRAWYAERGLTWLVRAIEVQLVAPVAYGDAVDVWTAIVGERRVMARRASRITSAGREPVAFVWTDWVLTGPGGAPTRIPDDFADWLAGAPERFDPLRVGRAEPPAGTSAIEVRVRARDLDPMAHVNNTVYLDYLEEAIAAAGGGATLAALPRRYAMEYVGAATAGDDLVALAWPTDAGWAHRLLRASDGAVLLRGTLAAAGDAS